MCQNQCEPLWGPCAIALVALHPSQAPSSPQTWAVPEPVAVPSHNQARCCSLSQLKSIFPSDLSPSWGQLLQREGCFALPFLHPATAASMEEGATSITTASKRAARRKASSRQWPAHILSPFGLEDLCLPTERAFPAACPTESGWS